MRPYLTNPIYAELCIQLPLLAFFKLTFLTFQPLTNSSYSSLSRLYHVHNRDMQANMGLDLDPPLT